MDSLLRFCLRRLQTLMKKISVYIIIIFFTQMSFAEKIETNIIVENCKACHSGNYSANGYIPSIRNLEKKEFISKMNAYKDSKEERIMERISRVLTYEDIIKIANYIYD